MTYSAFQHKTAWFAVLLNWMALAFLVGSGSPTHAESIDFLKADGTRVTVKDVSGQRFPVAGTFTPSGTGDVNLVQIDGTAASVNTGNADAGTLRVVLPSNQPAIPTTGGYAQGSTTAGQLLDLAGCAVVSGDSSFTAGQTQPCTLTTTGRLKVGLSSAATNGATAATINDLMGGKDGSGNQQPFAVDTSGRMINVGAAANGAAVAGNPVLIAGWDLTNARTIRTDTTGEVVLSAGSTVQGTVASGSADSGNPVKVGCKYNVTLPTFADGNRADCQSDTRGGVNVVLKQANGAAFAGIAAASDGAVTATGLVTNNQNTLYNGSVWSFQRTIQGADGTGQGVSAVGVTAPIVATYSANSSGFVPAAAATDIFTITGSASKVIRITRIDVSCIATAAGNNYIILTKRSTPDSGGTPSALNKVPNDSSFGAATASVISYTANPSLGTPIGNVRSGFIPFGTATSGGANPYSFMFGTPDFGAPIVLRGTSEVLAVNYNAQTIAGNICNIGVQWTEQ